MYKPQSCIEQKLELYAFRTVQMIILIPFGDIQMPKDSDISINNAMTVNIPMPMYISTKLKRPNRNYDSECEDDFERANKNLKENFDIELNLGL